MAIGTMHVSHEESVDLVDPDAWQRVSLRLKGELPGCPLGTVNHWNEMLEAEKS